MKSEKFFNSRIFAFFEILYKLIIINLITAVTIVLGLGLFSLVPALISASILIKSIVMKEEFPILKIYFYSFFKNWVKAELLFIVYLLLIVLFTFNAYYFYSWTMESSNVFYGISYYLFLFCDIITLIALLNACFVYVYYPYLSIKKIIKYSFVLLKATTWKALTMFIILIGMLYLTFLVVYFLPIFFISIYIYIYLLLINDDYLRMIPPDRYSLSSQYYLNLLREKS